MSSIAYVVDKMMLEYHRLAGNQTMNFWRVKSNKSFVDFKKGDLLFFLAKKIHKGRTKEKGIVGFGRLNKMSEMNVEKMWNTYKELNGYNSKEDLEQAIIKTTKDKVLPEEMECLELDDVVFFHEPIFLSDFDCKISKNVESYIYLDHIDPLLSSKIIQTARVKGLDTWTMMIYNQENPDTLLDKIELNLMLNKIHDEVKDIEYDDNDLVKAKRIINKFNKNNKNYQHISDSKTELYLYNEGYLNIVLPLINNKSMMYKLVLGQLRMYEMLIDKYYPYIIKIDYTLVDSNQNLISIK